MKQTQPINEGSIINRIMGNNETVPVVGEGATILMCSDRYAYTVLAVSKDGKECTIRECDPIDVKPYEGYAQSYEENTKNPEIKLVYRNGAWRRVKKDIVWIDGARELHGADKIWNEETCKLNLVEGFSKIKMSYPKCSIVFGRRDYYRDPSF